MIKYIDKEIESIIKSGSVKKKARLFLRDRMGYSGTGFILDYETIDRLVLSVRDEEREEWNRHVSFGLRLENAFKDLSSLVLRISEARNQLQRDLVDVMEFERYEETLNRLLVPYDFGETLDSGLMREIGPEKSEVHRVNLSGFTLTEPKIKQDGLFDLSLSGRESAPIDRAEKDLNELKELVNTFVQYESAMYKRLSESKLDIPEYDEVMNRNRAEVEREVSLCPRWIGYQDNRLRRIGVQRFNPFQNPLPALRDMKRVYLVRPEMFDPDIDEIRKNYNQI